MWSGAQTSHFWSFKSVFTGQIKDMHHIVNWDKYLMFKRCPPMYYSYMSSTNTSTEVRQLLYYMKLASPLTDQLSPPCYVQQPLTCSLTPSFQNTFIELSCLVKTWVKHVQTERSRWLHYVGDTCTSEILQPLGELRGWTCSWAILLPWAVETVDAILLGCF